MTPDVSEWLVYSTRTRDPSWRFRGEAIWSVPDGVNSDSHQAGNESKDGNRLMIYAKGKFGPHVRKNQRDDIYGGLNKERFFWEKRDWLSLTPVIHWNLVLSVFKMAGGRTVQIEIFFAHTLYLYTQIRLGCLHWYKLLTVIQYLNFT